MKRRQFVQNISMASAGVIIVKDAVLNKDNNQTIKQTKIADQPKAISIIAPSTIRVNESFSVGILILTEPYFTPRASKFSKSLRGITFLDNTLPEWKGNIHISGSDGYSGISKYSFTEGKGPYQRENRPIRRLEGFRFTEPGIKYIKVIDPESGIEGVSNAIMVSKDKMEEQLFWSDTHCHSFFGDGIRSPEELHTFARDEAFLDVFAHTEHGEVVTDDQWSYFMNVANCFYEPGKYVSLIGGEWTSKPFGHRNYIYPGSSGPIIRSNDKSQDNLKKLFTIVGENKGLVVANHPGDPDFLIDFDTFYHDPEVERLVEMYSIGGGNETPSSERIKKGVTGKNSVIGALKKGHKLGAIGVGDTHDGRPGDAKHELQVEPEYYNVLKKPGLTGIWAKDLTRESIFDALWNRRVYATTHHRTIVKFSANDFPMGSIINVKDELNLEAEIASDLSY